MTKDRDVGRLIHRDQRPHSGVMLIDDLGNANEETRLIADVLATHGERLAAAAFLRVGASGVRMSAG